jgi:hypothetical protein
LDHATAIDSNVTICHYTYVKISSLPSPSALDQRIRLVLLGQLQEAEAEHDRVRRVRYAGASAAILDADKAGWRRIGEAVADLARSIEQVAAVSALGEARPKSERLVARLTESFDDQIDREAWLIVDAAARQAVAP